LLVPTLQPPGFRAIGSGSGGWTYRACETEEIAVKVLIAVDDSSWSQAAMDFVTQMSWPAGTEMTVLSAAAPMTSAYAFQDFSEGASFLTPDMVEQQRLYHEKVAKRCALRLRELGHPVHSEAPVADPREAIV
jgi:hypothetical protein